MSDDILLIIWLVDKMAAYQYSMNLIPHIGTKTFRTENAVEWRLDSTSTTQFFCQIGVISFFVTFLQGLKQPRDDLLCQRILSKFGHCIFCIRNFKSNLKIFI